MKTHRTYFLAVLSTLGSLTFCSCDRSTDQSVDPIEAQIGKVGEVYSNYTLERNNSKNKHFSELVGEVKPGQSIFILESSNHNEFKIQLADGTMGWINGDYLKPSENTYVRHDWGGGNQHIASNRGAIGADRKIVKEVTDKTAVTRLEEYREVKKIRGIDNVVMWTKVRTEDGIEGWIMSDYLYPVYLNPYRFISRKNWKFAKEEFIEDWKGESIEGFAQKFKEPSGIKVEEKQNTYYFNNIFLFDDHEEHYGLRVYVKDSLIENIETAAQKTSWVSYMPLSDVLRINLIANYLGNWDYLFETTGDPEQVSIDMRDYLPTWLYWIVVLLIFLIALAILYFILKIPFIIVNKLTYKQSLNRKLFNGRIMLYAVLGSIIIGYTFSLVLLINVYPFTDFFFITALFCLGMILGNIGKWRNDLDYNRCNAATCHQWTGEHNGTEFLGGETVTRTYNDGSTRKQTTRRYREYRKCSACGNEWSIYRREVFGGLKY